MQIPKQTTNFTTKTNMYSVSATHIIEIENNFNEFEDIEIEMHGHNLIFGDLNERNQAMILNALRSC